MRHIYLIGFMGAGKSTIARALQRKLSLSLVEMDERIVRDARTGTATVADGGNGSTGGLIDTQRAVGGWPEYRQADAPEDGDGDGIPDAWERLHGLDPADPEDGARVDAGSGYTWLERYLNSLVETITDKQNTCTEP